MMLRIVLFLMMATGLAGFGTVAWLSTRPAPAPVPVAVAPPPPAPHVMLLAAGHMMRPGTLLKPDDVVVTDTLASAAPAGATTDTPSNRAALVGAMVRRTVLANQVILPGDMLRPGEHGFLAAVLTPGMRATSVAVDAVTGTAGLIWPGDHVDLLLTQTLEDQSLPLSRRIAGETVLAGVRVIAIDQQLAQGGNATGAEPQPARTVTLEVTPPQAERVAVASRLGHLTLVVRAAEDAATPAQADAAPAPEAPMLHAATTTPAAGPIPTLVSPGRTTAAASPAPVVMSASATLPARAPAARATPAPTPVPAPAPAPATAPAATPTPSTTGITWGGDVSAALDAGRKGTNSQTSTLRVFEGSSDGKEFHF